MQFPLKHLVEVYNKMECSLEYAISAIIGLMTYCFTREEQPDIEKTVVLLNGFMNNGIIGGLLK